SVTQPRNAKQPDEIQLYQNYPNPFNPTTTIRYSIPEKNHVLLKVFNLLGKEVAILVDGVQSTGEYTVRFDGSGFASGVYFYKLESGNFQKMRKFTLIR
ncbi:T9SS type A sorting domain-containing protein, partial [candidate division KSB1 bacterium]|nr:T9SS type A sorting domain-containing protein [candidate division KSB1 bacterium]